MLYSMAIVLRNSWRHDYFFVERRKDITTFAEMIYYLYTNEDRQINVFIARELYPGFKRSRKNAFIAAHSRTHAASVLFDRLNCWGAVVKGAIYHKTRKTCMCAIDETTYRRNSETRFNTAVFQPATQTYRDTFIFRYEDDERYTIGKF